MIRRIDVDIARLLGCNPEQEGPEKIWVCPCRQADHADKDMRYWTGVPVLRDWSYNWTYGGMLVKLMAENRGTMTMEYSEDGWDFRGAHFRMGVNYYYRGQGEDVLHAVCRATLDWARRDPFGFQKTLHEARGWWF